MWLMKTLLTSGCTNQRGAGHKVSTLPMSDEMVRAAAEKNPVMQGMVKLLGVDMSVSHEKATTRLGWKPRDPHKAIVATAESLIALNLV